MSPEESCSRGSESATGGCYDRFWFMDSLVPFHSVVDSGKRDGRDAQASFLLRDA